MPGCVLRVAGPVSGEDLDVDKLLLSSPLSPSAVFYRGKPRSGRSGKLNRTSGFHVVVSDAAGEHVAAQVDEARAFLDKFREALLALKADTSVQTMCLDFGCTVDFQHTAATFTHLPSGLLERCSYLGVEIEMSIYTGDDGAEGQDELAERSD